MEKSVAIGIEEIVAKIEEMGERLTAEIDGIDGRISDVQKVLSVALGGFSRP